MEIKRIILATFGYVYEYRKHLAKALLFPVVIIVALGAIPIHETGLALVAFQAIFSLIIASVLAITTHRIILLGPNYVSEWGVYIPGKREFYFVLYSVGLGILMMIPLMVFSLIPIVGWFITIVATLYIMARLSLVFPAIATDQSWSFADSWNATKYHQVPMMVVVAIFPLVISIPGLLLSYVPYVGLLIDLLSAFTVILVIAALSVAFQVIKENGGKS